MDPKRVATKDGVNSTNMVSIEPGYYWTPPTKSRCCRMPGDFFSRPLGRGCEEGYTERGRMLFHLWILMRSTRTTTSRAGYVSWATIQNALATGVFDVEIVSIRRTNSSSKELSWFGLVS